MTTDHHTVKLEEENDNRSEQQIPAFKARKQERSRRKSLHLSFLCEILSPQKADQPFSTGNGLELWVRCSNSHDMCSRLIDRDLATPQPASGASMGRSRKTCRSAMLAQKKRKQAACSSLHAVALLCLMLCVCVCVSPLESEGAFRFLCVFVQGGSGHFGKHCPTKTFPLFPVMTLGRQSHLPAAL